MTWLSFLALTFHINCIAMIASIKNVTHFTYDEFPQRISRHIYIVCRIGKGLEEIVY